MLDEPGISILGKSYPYNIDRFRYALAIPILIFVVIHIGHEILNRNYHTKFIFGYIDGPAAMLYMAFLVVLFSALTIVSFALLLTHWKQDRRIVIDEECLYVVHGDDFENAEDCIPYTAMQRLSVLDSNSFGWRKVVTFKIDCVGGDRSFYKDSFTSVEEFEDFISEITKRSDLERLHIAHNVELS